MICSSGIGFDPYLDETRLTFGFHGIWQGTGLLYDHQTGSLWMHLSGRCFEGPLKGKRLARIKSGRHTTWSEWRQAHPDTDVIAEEPRLVGRRGDEGYFKRDGSFSGAGYLPKTFDQTIKSRDDRLTLNELLYGIEIPRADGTSVARAYPLKALRRAKVIEEDVVGTPVTIWFKKEGRTAAGFDRRVKGKPHTFAPAAGGMQDKETGSAWTFDGFCVEGTYRGQRLRALHGLMAEWYGWYAHYPATTVWTR